MINVAGVLIQLCAEDRKVESDIANQGKNGKQKEQGTRKILTSTFPWKPWYLLQELCTCPNLGHSGCLSLVRKSSHFFQTIHVDFLRSAGFLGLGLFKLSWHTIWYHVCIICSFFYCHEYYVSHITHVTCVRAEPSPPALLPTSKTSRALFIVAKDFTGLEHWKSEKTCYFQCPRSQLSYLQLSGDSCQHRKVMEEVMTCLGFGLAEAWSHNGQGTWPHILLQGSVDDLKHLLGLLELLGVNQHAEFMIGEGAANFQLTHQLENMTMWRRFLQILPVALGNIWPDIRVSGPSAWYRFKHSNDKSDFNMKSPKFETILNYIKLLCRTCDSWRAKDIQAGISEDTWGHLLFGNLKTLGPSDIFTCHQRFIREMWFKLFRREASAGVDEKWPLSPRQSKRPIVRLVPWLRAHALHLPAAG